MNISTHNGIPHKREGLVRRTISLPQDLFEEITPRAAEFPDFSKYCQSLFKRDAEAHPAAQESGVKPQIAEVAQ